MKSTEEGRIYIYSIHVVFPSTGMCMNTVQQDRVQRGIFWALFFFAHIHTYIRTRVLSLISPMKVSHLYFIQHGQCKGI